MEDWKPGVDWDYEYAAVKAPVFNHDAIAAVVPA
jgi:hypothetical protein